MPDNAETNSSKAGSWVSLAEQKAYEDLKIEYALLEKAYRRLGEDFADSVASVLRLTFTLDVLRQERDALRAERKDTPNV